MIFEQVLTEVTLEVGSLGEEVGVAVPLPEGQEVISLIKEIITTDVIAIIRMKRMRRLKLTPLI